LTNRISPRIVLHGFYGAGNLGDEAILAGILRGLRNQSEQFEAWVVSASPEATERLHGVRAIDRHDLHGIANLLENAHALLFGGGGLCNDYWSTRASDVLDDAWGSLAYYLRLPLLAGIVNVPVEIFGQGVGPLNDLEARRQVGYVFSNAAHLNVRDPESAALLRELGVRGEIEVSPDPAFLLDPDTERGKEALANSGVAVGKAPLIGLSVRQFPSLSQAMLENLVDGVGRFASDIDGRVVLLPFSSTSSSDDLTLCRELAKNIGGSAVIVTDEVTPAAMAGLFEHLDLAVAIRLHASIFALAASVPTVPIAYDRKVSSFASQAGLTCLTTSSVDGESVRARLHREWESREVSRSNLSLVAAEWRAAAGEAMDGLCRRLETARDRLVDDPEEDKGRIDEPLIAQHMDPRVGADDEADPERQDQQQHEQPLVLKGRVGDEIGGNVACDGADQGGQDRDAQRLPYRDVIIAVGEELLPIGELERRAVDARIDVKVKGINEDDPHGDDDQEQNRQQRRGQQHPGARPIGLGG